MGRLLCTEVPISPQRFKVIKFPYFPQTLVIHDAHTHLCKVANMRLQRGESCCLPGELPFQMSLLRLRRGRERDRDSI